jgi:hypothetical protein
MKTLSLLRIVETISISVVLELDGETVVHGGRLEVVEELVLATRGNFALVHPCGDDCEQEINAAKSDGGYGHDVAAHSETLDLI